MSELNYKFMMSCGHNSYDGEECIAECPNSEKLFSVAKVESNNPKLDFTYVRTEEVDFRVIGEEEIPKAIPISKMNKKQLREVAKKLGVSGIGSLTVSALRIAIKAVM